MIEVEALFSDSEIHINGYRVSHYTHPGSDYWQAKVGGNTVYWSYSLSEVMMYCKENPNDQINRRKSLEQQT